MTHPAFPPMPVVLSTRDEAAEHFGVGSFAHCVMSRIDPPPPPTPAETAEQERLIAEATRATERYYRLPYAFSVVAECIALVDVHARALHGVDATRSPDGAFIPDAGLNYDQWYAMAHAALARIYDLAPELLPIGPDVHADCVGDS